MILKDYLSQFRTFDPNTPIYKFSQHRIHHLSKDFNPRPEIRYISSNIDIFPEYQSFSDNLFKTKVLVLY